LYLGDKLFKYVIISTLSCTYTTQNLYFL